MNDKKVDISVRGKTEIERLILILNIGLMTAMEEGTIEPDETEYCLYSPYSLEVLKEKGVRKEIVDLIHKGLFIDDTKRLCNDKSAYLKTVCEIKNEALRLLSTLPKVGEYSHWLL
ncbi:MAG TPA: DUF3969 family protein [Clostridia bacterium]